MSVPTRDQLDGLVRARLQEDPAFRDLLLSDPRAALGDLTGTEVPDFITVTVHEESLTDVHLVIPAALGEEVTEDDLELVAGGGNCWDNCGCSM